MVLQMMLASVISGETVLPPALKSRVRAYIQEHPECVDTNPVAVPYTTGPVVHTHHPTSAAGMNTVTSTTATTTTTMTTTSSLSNTTPSPVTHVEHHSDTPVIDNQDSVFRF